MTENTIRLCIPFFGLLYNVLKKSTEKVSIAASESIIEPTIEIVENIVENAEVFFHREKTFGLVFLFIVIVIIQSYKLKNG